MIWKVTVGSNEDMLASTSLYTLHFVSLPHHLLIWSLFTLLVSYPVEQARRQYSCGWARPAKSGLSLTINVITSPQWSFYEHGDAYLAFKESTLTNCIHIGISATPEIEIDLKHI
jgi:hypothetical protein